MKRNIKENLPHNKRTGTGEEFEIDYWSKEFGISKDELKEAAKAGKTPAEAVEKYVQKLELTNA